MLNNMIKKIVKKVMHEETVYQCYCDMCGIADDTRGEYSSPTGWVRFAKSGETILNMTNDMICEPCYDNKLRPWLESQKNPNE